MAHWTPSQATRPSARNGPKMAPRLSIIRSKPYARPYALAGTMSASSALRAGTRRPRVVQAAARSTPTCQTEVAAAVAAPSMAVVVQPPTATLRRLAGSSARMPPPKRAAPASASETPSIAPSAAAGAPRVEVSREGSKAVGSRGRRRRGSWPRRCPVLRWSTIVPAQSKKRGGRMRESWSRSAVFSTPRPPGHWTKGQFSGRSYVVPAVSSAPISRAASRAGRPTPMRVADAGPVQSP